MTKITKALLIIVFSLCILPCIVYSQGGIIVEPDPESKTVLVSGNVSEVSGIVTVFVAPKKLYDVTALTVDDINSKKVIVRQTVCGESGDFAVNIKIPPHFSSGTYNVFAGFGKNMYTGKFSYINDGEISTLFGQLNDAEKEEFNKLITDNIDALGIDAEEFLSNQSDILNGLYTEKPADGYDAASFSNMYQTITAIINTIESYDELDNNVYKYQTLYSVDYEKDFKNCGETVKKDFFDYLSDINFEEDFASEYPRRCFLLARITGAVNYMDIQDFILENYEELDIDLDEYEKLASDYSKTAVFSLMIDSEINEFSDIKKNFDECVKKRAEQDEKDKDDEEDGKTTGRPTGGGGGGGGGGGIASAATVKDIVEKAEQNEAGKEPLTDEKNDSKKDNDNQNKLSDIENHWGFAYINSLVDNGIVNGFSDNTFRPDNSVTRAEFVEIILGAIGDSEKGTSEFEDVKETDWYSGYISRAADLGIINGYNNKAEPDGRIRREDAAVILHRTLKLKNAAPKSFEAVSFNDSEEISDYAKEAVEGLAADGIISGSDNRFYPNANLSRAEACALIYRFLEYINGNEGLE